MVTAPEKAVVLKPVDLSYEQAAALPTLAIGTTHSGTSTVQALGPHAKDVRSVVAPTGHFVAEEDPNWFTETVTAFLD